MAKPEWVKVRSIQTTQNGDRNDGYYASARSQIERGDYGQALLYLHAARQRDPNDARVLNALGVVYDKLGRFDLSARYYAEANIAEPGSPIISRNLAYSAELQALASGERREARQTQATQVFPPAAPAVMATVTLRPAIPAPRLVAAGNNVLRLEIPTQTAAVIPNGRVTGYPLAVVDATGQRGVAERVRHELAGRGWSAPASAVSTVLVAASTEIQYTEYQTRVAKALARTLPVAPKMVLCTEACTGIRLIVGRDAAAWGFGKSAIVVRAG